MINPQYTDTENVKVSNNSTKTFLTNDGKDGIFGAANTNIFSIKEMDKATNIDNNGVVINPLYSINDICIKSTIEKIDAIREKTTSEKTSESYIDIYAPTIDNDLTHICQYGTYTLALMPRTSNGPNYLTTNLSKINKEISSNIHDTIYNWQITSKSINTYIYNTKDTLNSTDSKIVSNYYKPKYNLIGFKCNYILEIPTVLGINSYNDYEAGDILGDVVQTKNQYDSTYSINMPEISCIDNTRDYIDINVCGNQPYLKYYDNVNYNTGLQLSTQVVTTNYDAIQPVIVAESNNDNYKKYPFQKIETLDYINRFRNANKHKSPLYSLKINKTGISYISDLDARERIRKEITNNIRQITKKICPVQTQLFDVYFSED